MASKKSRTDIEVIDQQNIETPGKLTKQQEALLAVLRDPAVLALNVDKICKLAGISRATYYNAWQSSEFQLAVRSLKQEIMTASSLPVIHQLAKMAVGEKSNSHHYMKMFLQVNGDLEPEAQTPSKIVVNFNVNRPQVTINVEGKEKEEKIIEGEIVSEN